MNFIIDAHLDIAYNALCFSRDYRNGAHRTRALERGGAQEKENGQCIVGLPDMLRARVGLTFGTIFVGPRNATTTPLTEALSYTTVKEAHASGVRQLDWYHRWADREQHIRLIKTRRDLTELLAAWGMQASPAGALTPAAKKRAPGEIHPLGVMLLMESADPVREPKELEWWYERGVRAIGPAWAGTRYCGGTRAPGPLTDLGRELLEHIAAFGMILDLSHMAEASSREALDRFEGKSIMASHSNPQKITPTDRHLPDDVIRGIAARGGVIGSVLYNRFLRHTWARPEPKQAVTIDDIIRCIDYVCQLTGSADHAALGSDFDGGLGAESIPAELDTSRDLGKIGQALLKRGYTRADVDKINHGNWLRLMQTALPD
ncbi:MAG: dipeptidase [Thermoflexales bacterium]|nr:dipeptidase [Thermoflexales bacterium]